MASFKPGAEQWWQHAMLQLRNAGHPVTSQREAVVRCLAGNTGHPSAAEVHAAVPDASRSTVYKTLSLLVSLGVADAVPSPSGELRFDPRTDAHDHFFCVSCGGMTDIPAGAASIDIPRGFLAQRQRICVEGYCPACA